MERGLVQHRGSGLRAMDLPRGESGGRRMLRRWVSGEGGLRRLAGDGGAVTAEYAIATMAAVGFAGLLVVVLRSDEVRGLLFQVVSGALQLPG